MPLLKEQAVQCPYCGETISVLVDSSSIAEQGLQHIDYIEDCEVCCRPIAFLITPLGSDDYALQAMTENE